MSSEPKQKKSKIKTEEEIRKEVKAELEKEIEIKENAKKELIEQQKQEEMKEYNKKKRGKKVFKIISCLISTILFLFILFETIMGVLDMQRLNDDKEPIWYIDSKVENIDDKEETTYNLGLYVIVKTKDETKTKIILKPFFLK